MILPFPDIHIYQFDTGEVADPSGTRNIEGGSFAFVRRVGLNCSTYSGSGTSGTMQFETIVADAVTPASHHISPVSALLFRLNASGVGISNMTLYLVDQTGLTLPAAYYGLPSAFIQMTASGIWQPNCTLPSGAGTRLSTVVPSQNIYRQDGKLYLAGEQDKDVSQWVYLNVVIPHGFPNGDFGACGSGQVRFAFAFDYWDSEQFLQFGDP
jgi:hypothetical protein